MPANLGKSFQPIRKAKIMNLEKSWSLRAEPAKPSPANSVVRVILAIAIGAAAAAYICCILLGVIPAAKKLGLVELTIILIAAAFVSILLRPELLDRLTHFKLGSLEFELEKLQRAQRDQRIDLNDLRFVLTLMLKPSEMQHLMNLESGSTRDCAASDTLRAELRKLRAMGLIRSRNGKKIAELADQRKWDLGDFVELTDLGRRYLDRLGEDE